jgi:hypothetical protein
MVTYLTNTVASISHAPGPSTVGRLGREGPKVVRAAVGVGDQGRTNEERCERERQPRHSNAS